MILRNFLFLDTDTISNYLSTLEGYVEVEVDETETQQAQKGGKLTVKLVEGSGASERSQSTKRKLAVTDAAQFQKLYEILEDNDNVQYLDGFDEEIWNQLRRNEIVEIQAKIRLPDPLLLFQEAQDLEPLIEVMQLIGQDPLSDPQANMAYTGMTTLSKGFEKKPVPLLFHAASTPKFQFFASLPRQCLRCELSDLQGEAVIFGKIHRFLEKGKTETVFSIAPELKAMTKLNRKQRRSMKSSKSSKDFAEMIKGPAIIVIPIAIYL